MFTMRFLGDDQIAPLLKDADLERPDEAAKQAVALVEKMIDAFIVHSDLSEYNIVMWGERLFAIDFPQAVDFSSRVTRHLRIEEAKPLLLRGLRNLESFFTKHDVVIDAESEYRRLLRKLDQL
jgi:RIO kinase 1